LALEFSRVVSRFIPRGQGIGIALAGTGMVAFVVVLAVFAPYLTSYDPTRGVGPSLSPPSADHLMGTNRLGYDVYSRILYGAQTILVVVLLSTMISMIAGIPLGLISGYSGGVVDRSISVVMDSIYVFPGLILAIAMAAVLGPGMINASVAIAIVYIPTYFRMARGQTLSIKEQTYIEAMRAIGCKARTIVFRHVLPNILPTLTVVFSLNVADAVLTEAGLSFFGLSVPAPIPDWGYDLRAGQPFLPSGYWWLITFPGLMIIMLAIGFSLIGEGLNELTSPWMAKK